MFSYEPWERNLSSCQWDNTILVWPLAVMSVASFAIRVDLVIRLTDPYFPSLCILTELEGLNRQSSQKKEVGSSETSKWESKPPDDSYILHLLTEEVLP